MQLSVPFLIAVLFLLVGNSVQVRSAPDSCTFKTCHHSFNWTNSSASVAAPGTFEYKCPISDFRKNKHYTSLKGYQIAYVGDSFDLQGCSHLREYNTTNNETWIWNDHTSHIHCYRDAHIDVSMLRISGIVRANHNSSTMPSFSAVSQFFNVVKPDVIVVSSFAWDLKLAREHFCSEGRKEENPCLCIYQDFEKPQCASVANAQTFNRMQIPWCGPDFLSNWASTLFELITLVQSLVPSVKVFVRSQPFASSLFTGNPACFASMNALALQMSNTLLRSDESAGSCRFLDMNALLAPVVGTQLGHNPSTSHNDGLHYWDARHVWTEYLMNTIIDNVAVAKG